MNQELIDTKKKLQQAIVLLNKVVVCEKEEVLGDINEFIFENK